jgi:hypothetical protein
MANFGRTQIYWIIAGLMLCIAGFWGVWLAHPVAALQLSGYELGDWVTLLPGVQLGQLPFQKWHFRLPWILVLWQTWGYARPLQLNRWARLAGALVLLGSLLLLPDPASEPLGNPLPRQQLLIWAATLGGLAVLSALEWLGQNRMRSLLLLGLASATLAINWWLLTQVLPAATPLYGKTPSVGWGWVAMQGGALLLLVAALLQRLAERMTQKK